MAVIRVLLKDDKLRLSLPGIPNTLQELYQILRETFAIEEDFKLEYQDDDFNGAFFTVHDMRDVKDKSTIKVVFTEPFLTLSVVDPVPVLSSTATSSEVWEEGSSISESDTIILTSPERSSSGCSFAENIPLLTRSDGTSLAIQSETPVVSSESLAFPTTYVSRDATAPESSSLRSLQWPAVFELPKFSLDTELLLEAADVDYRNKGTLFNRHTVRSDILQKLVEAIFVYTPYPTKAQKTQMLKALIKKHPCLKDPGDATDGIKFWMQKLVYKIDNYRAKMRSRHSIPEIMVNTLKKKAPGAKNPSKNVKRAKKSEVNFLPPHLEGETDETLEAERVALLYENKKKDNKRVVSDMLAKTFSLRRSEIIQNPDTPVIVHQGRWPALFECSQIEEEFRRITLKPLKTTFLQKLDQHTPKLLSLFRSKGGAVGKKLGETLEVLNKDYNIESRREAVIRGLFLYLGEQPELLIKDYKVVEDDDAENVNKEITALNLNIFMVSRGGDGEDRRAGVAIEGNEVLFGIPCLAHACVYLMGLIYTLDLEYPPKVDKTLMVFQNIFLELEGRYDKKGKVYALYLSLTE